MKSVKKFMEFLNQERRNRREQAIAETGVDPKTGLTHRHMVLSEKTRTRGGSKSRRKTARVWVPAERPETD